MSRLLAPGLVTSADIIAYDLDGVPLTPTDVVHHGERFIHGEIYRARPDVMSVVHGHAIPLLPFATMVGATIHEAVYRGIYARLKAFAQLEAMRLGPVKYLAPEEPPSTTSSPER